MRNKPGKWDVKTVFAGAMLVITGLVSGQAALVSVGVDVTRDAITTEVEKDD